MDTVLPVLEGWSRGELRVQRCRTCEGLQFPPRAVCLRCRSDALGWDSVAPRGTIASVTVVHRAPTPVWKAKVPYAITLVDLAPGVRMMMNLVGDGVDTAAIGAAVAITFADSADGQSRPQAHCLP